MAVAGPPQIGRANFVRLKNSDGRGPHEKTVVIVMDARVVFVVMNAELGRVARLDEILHVKICDDHLLVAELECVEAAIRVFLEQVEVGGVVFPAV
jgi:hypothetical protein